MSHGRLTFGSLEGARQIDHKRQNLDDQECDSEPIGHTIANLIRYVICTDTAHFHHSIAGCGPFWGSPRQLFPTYLDRASRQFNGQVDSAAELQTRRSPQAQTGLLNGAAPNQRFTGICDRPIVEAVALLLRKPPLFRHAGQGGAVRPQLAGLVKVNRAVLASERQNRLLLVRQLCSHCILP